MYLCINIGRFWQVERVLNIKIRHSYKKDYFETNDKNYMRGKYLKKPTILL